MRLINCKSLDNLHLESFEPSSTPEKYAILSHTWETSQQGRIAREVLYEDFQHGAHLRNDSNEMGWRKIEGACKQAKAFDKDIEYVWVDGCCINKKDAAELTEAINSMFQWYAQSTVCIAYLSDMEDDVLSPEAKWFSRGWTLQELVASPEVRFYNKNWDRMGSKSSLSNMLAEFTSINVEVLEAKDEKSIARALHTIPVCQKMSWASKRLTTKVEDKAYCLLGLFDIHIPLLYGEGKAAFRRLQEAIIDKYNDLSILAWMAKYTVPDAHTSKNVMYSNPNNGEVGPMPGFGHSDCYHGILACDPREFEHAGSISSCFPKGQSHIYNPEFSNTNKGVKITTFLRKGWPFGSYIMPLMCRSDKHSNNQSLGIFLKWVGGATYVRANCTELKTLRSKDLQQTPGQDEFYLAPSVEQLHHSTNDLDKRSIHVPLNPYELLGKKTLDIRNTKVSPGYMWDGERRMFLGYGHQNPVGCAWYSVSGLNDTLFVAFFGLDLYGSPWLCLAGRGSDLLPSHIERRREFLTRVALEAQRRRTSEIVIELDDNKNRARTSVAVKGGFRTDSVDGPVPVDAGQISLDISFETAQSEAGKVYGDPFQD